MKNIPVLTVNSVVIRRSFKTRSKNNPIFFSWQKKVGDPSTTTIYVKYSCK